MSGRCISIAPTTRHRWCACPSISCLRPPGAHPEVWLRSTPNLRFAVLLQPASTLAIVSGLLLEPIPRCISFLSWPSCWFSKPPPPPTNRTCLLMCSQLSFCSLMEACFVFRYSADRAYHGHSTDSVCDWLPCWISFPFPDTTRHRWCACPSIRYLRVPGARLLSHCSSPAVTACRCMHRCTSAFPIL